MAQALSDLLAEETRLKSLPAPSVSVSHGVLTASRRFGASRGTSSMPCKHCGKTGHSAENCFAQHPEKLAEYRARRASRGRDYGDMVTPMPPHSHLDYHQRVTKTCATVFQRIVKSICIGHWRVVDKLKNI
uniref:CCHC-type domain-containing protein n=1 Tax=Oryza glumipatula TaxID=40148 RepID=A0A0E0AZZ9_9ORYZ